jgi:urease accessory protein
VSRLPLFVWLSPAFPVGAFAFSHGLEWAQEAGDVVDAATLEAWLHDLLAFGSARNDCLLFAEAYRAAQGNDLERLGDVAQLAVALASSAERRLETVTTGNAFLIAAQKSWPCAALDLLAAAQDEAVPYPVAVGAACAGHAVPLDEALPAYALAFVANLVSAAGGHGVVGQTDGQRVIAALMPAIEEAAAFAIAGTLDDLGGAAFRSDLAALRHETQYTRLFRS